MRRALVLTFFAVVLLAACAGDRGVVIEMQSGQRFAPAQLHIQAGQTVTWSNESSESHTVTAFEDSIPEGAEYFASGGASSEAAARDDVADGLLKPGDTFQMTFDVPGTYRFFCIPHESSGMKGTVVVAE
jgi:plastocyanin